MQNPFADDPSLRLQARLAALRYHRRLPSATVGESYLSVLSDHPHVRLLDGTRLPPGIRCQEGVGLAGTPVAACSDAVEFEEGPSSGVRRWPLEVADPPRMEIVQQALPAASVGTYLCTQMRLIAPALPVIWSVCNGRLPPGLRLDAHSGRLYGVPTQAGVWCCSLRAQLGARAALSSLVVVVQPGAARRRPPGLPGQGVLAEIRLRRSGPAAVEP